MHDDEVETDSELIRRLLVAQLNLLADGGKLSGVIVLADST
jgi:hypothetical protein